MKKYNRHIKMISPSQEKKNGAASLAGSAHIFLLAIALIVFVAGGCYLYSVNRTAVQGYHMRALEQGIGKLKQENAELKITEADLRSLYRIEASEEARSMQKLENIIYLEERGPVALLK